VLSHFCHEEAGANGRLRDACPEKAMEVIPVP
jgi:hypothetical protein